MASAYNAPAVLSDTACAANFRIPSGRAAGTDTTMRIALNSEQTIRAGSGGSYTFRPVLTILSVS